MQIKPRQKVIWRSALCCREKEWFCSCLNQSCLQNVLEQMPVFIIDAPAPQRPLPNKWPAFNMRGERCLRSRLACNWPDAQDTDRKSIGSSDTVLTMTCPGRVISTVIHSLIINTFPLTLGFFPAENVKLEAWCCKFSCQSLEDRCAHNEYLKCCVEKSASGMAWKNDL